MSDAIERITRVLLDVRDRCIDGDQYDDPRRREKYDALNAVIDMINNPSVLFRKMHDGDLISREALIEEFRLAGLRMLEAGAPFRDCVMWAGKSAAMIDDAPAVDAVPVVHGRWVNQDNTYTRYRCSVCNMQNCEAHYKYCPNSGADMRGDCDATE